jgi:hypothetical protein
VAARTKIFIIDIQSLKRTLSDDDWQSMFKELFAREGCTKVGELRVDMLMLCNFNVVGFDFGGDLRILLHTLPSWRAVLHTIKDTICLMDVTTEVFVLHVCCVSISNYSSCT